MRFFWARIRISRQANAQLVFQLSVFVFFVGEPMGLDRTIRFPIDETPTWEAICSTLARIGETAPLRMIDGIPTFPDESPDPDWKELRLGGASGMVTIRRGGGKLICVIWGNADSALQAIWAKVIWACAVAGEGIIDSPDGPISPEQFAQINGLTIA